MLHTIVYYTAYNAVFWLHLSCSGKKQGYGKVVVEHNATIQAKYISHAKLQYNLEAVIQPRV